MSVKLRNSLGFFFAILANFSLWSMETPVENSSKESWKKTGKNHILVQESVLNIDKWPLINLQLAITNDAIFSNYEQHLLEILEDTVVLWGRSKVGSVKDLHAALLAIYQIIIIEASRTALQFAMHLDERAAGSVKWDEARKSDWLSATSRPEDFEWDTVDHAAQKAAWESINKIAYKEAKTKLTTALNDLNIQDLAKKGLASFKLSNLYFLSFISHKGFLLCADNVLGVIKHEINTKYDINTTKDGVIDFWATNYWNRKEFKSNPYMKTFKNIALKLAQSKKLN